MPSRIDNFEVWPETGSAGFQERRNHYRRSARAILALPENAPKTLPQQRASQGAQKASQGAPKAPQKNPKAPKSASKAPQSIPRISKAHMNDPR